MGQKGKTAPTSWYNMVKKGIAAFYADLPKTLADSLTPASKKPKNDSGYFAFASSNSCPLNSTTQDAEWEGEGLIIETKQQAPVAHTSSAISPTESSFVLPQWAQTPPKKEPARAHPLDTVSAYFCSTSNAFPTGDGGNKWFKAWAYDPSPFAIPARY